MTDAKVVGIESHTSQPQTSASVFFDESGLVVSKLGEAIRKKGHLRIGTDRRLWRYVEGVYRPDGETLARVAVREILAERWRRRHSIEVLDWLRADYASLEDRPPEGVINLSNGLLDWHKRELSKHSPGFASTVQLPVRWEPSAQCPRINTFLAEVVPEDAIDFVFEIIGYALYPGNPYRRAVLFLGSGCNGKTVLLLIIKALLGAANVSAVPLQVLSENRFATAELYGKLANICGDLDARSVRQTDIFKMLTGGDPIVAERKHRDPFTFVPFALPIFSANEPPLSSDQSEGWFDRWLVVPMDHRIPEDRVDPHLTLKLTTQSELEGLLVKAVEGLRRLMTRGRFDLPGSIQAACVQYRERLDTVQGFVAEECALDPEAWTPRSNLYRAYRSWAESGGRLPVSAVTFNDHLRRGFPGQLAERKRHGIFGWLGVGLLAERES